MLLIRERAGAGLVRAGNQGSDCLPLTLDVYQELKLGQGPGQIVTPVFDLEVAITTQVVTEEAQSQFKGDQAQGVKEALSFYVAQEARGFLKVSIEQGPAGIEIEFR